MGTHFAPHCNAGQRSHLNVSVSMLLLISKLMLYFLYSVVFCSIEIAVPNPGRAAMFLASRSDVGRALSCRVQAGAVFSRRRGVSTVPLVAYKPTSANESCSQQKGVLTMLSPEASNRRVKPTFQNECVAICLAIVSHWAQ